MLEWLSSLSLEWYIAIGVFILTMAWFDYEFYHETAFKVEKDKLKSR